VGVGETVLVEGPNGAGKTSLLRVCAGLVPSPRGPSPVLGLDPVRRRTAVRRRVGLLSHASHLYDDLTVQENIRFAVRAAAGDPGPHRSGLPALGADRAAWPGTPAAKLSAGQRRRVALAVLTARWPECGSSTSRTPGLTSAARMLLDEAIAEASAAGSPS